MRIYLVPPSVDIVVDLADKFRAKPDVLLSYAFRGSFFSHFLKAHRHKIGQLMLDSGAYSQMVGTTQVDLDSYIAFLRSCGHLFDYCINLDTDPGDYDIRNWNLARIRSQGFNPLPVVHDPYAGEIDKLYDQGYRYILIGSSHGNDRKQLDFIFNRYYHSGRFPGIRFHKLGTTTYATLSEYPFYSSDSATFAHIGGFGILLFWNDQREPDPNGDRTDKVYFGDRKGQAGQQAIDFKKYPCLRRLEDYLWRTFEYRLEDLVGSKGAEKRFFVNARYTLDLEERITRLHGD
jgi:hypothetical protein